MSITDYSAHFQNTNKVDRYEGVIYRAGSHDDVIWQMEKVLLQQLIHRYHADCSSADVMDFACGTGRVTEYLAKHQGELGSTLVGVDISPQMLEKAAPKVGETELVCADIVNEPSTVPCDKDIITCFRFLLLAEPTLRIAVTKQLVTKLRDDDSILIFSLHGNPKSFRALATLRNALFTRNKADLPRFGMRELRELCEQTGMTIAGATGTGFVPHSIAKFLPRRLFRFIERVLAGQPILWQFGTNLLVVCKRK